MYLTVKQQIKRLSKEQYRNLRELCHVAKDLTNQALYLNRQYFFETGKYLGFFETCNELKTCENYKILNSNMAQQIFRNVDSMFKSFFALLKLAKQGQYSGRVRMPRYLSKDGFAELRIQQFSIRNQVFTLPFSKQYGKEHSKISIKIPPVLNEKKIKFIKIIPIQNAKFFEIQYTYEIEENRRDLGEQKALAIDFGINNLMTCVSSEGKTFIIDGRRLKSINQWYNKQNARLSSVKDKQNFGKKFTLRQSKITRKRNSRVNDYISKASRKVINFCLSNRIGILVCGYNMTFQQNSNLRKRTNQNFVNIPFGKIRMKLKYLCTRYGILYIEQEESYTSKASFWDKDEIPVYDSKSTNKYIFSGKRTKRGLYQSSKGITLNADVNGAANILRKSKVVPLEGLYCRGELDTPLRIRIA